MTISPETPILDVYRMFIEEEIHGAPVVAEDGGVRGVVSTLDLLRIVRDELAPSADATTTTYFRDELAHAESEGTRLPEDLQDRVQHLTAEDAATRELVTVSPNATVEDVARKMLTQRVHRVLVVDRHGELQGVITTFDLLRVVAGIEPTPAAGLTKATGYRR